MSKWHVKHGILHVLVGRLNFQAAKEYGQFITRAPVVIMLIRLKWLLMKMNIMPI